jgi:regulatory protein
LGWLALREHSRQELRTKLLRALDRDRQQQANEGPVDRDAAHDEATSGVERVDKLLDALTSAGHLNESRFVESRVRVRAPRFGDRRIQAELRRHGLEAPQRAIHATAGTELARAHRVWLRKFGPQPSADRLEQARQARFLAARGFSAETVRDVIRGVRPPPPDDDDG